MHDEPISTRDRILSAAADLFYSDGIGRSSMDEIARRAGVTKRTLYYHFRSKDDMVGDWLQTLDQTVRDKYRLWLHAVSGPVEIRVRQMFTALAASVRDPRWKGCAFARAANELAGLPGHPGVVAAKEHRKRFESLFADELRADDIEPADRIARRVMLLLDGAIAQALIHHDPAYVIEAGEAAADIISAVRNHTEATPAVMPVPYLRGARLHHPV